MKKTSSRIHFSSKDKFEISIQSVFNAQKQALLVAWLVMWSVAGLAIIAQFFMQNEEDMTVYLVIWLAFWIYFEYKAIYAFRWRKYGLERIYLIDDVLFIAREISGRGIPGRYEVNWVKNLRIRDEQKRTFFEALGQSYWSPAGEKVMFDYKGKEIVFGIELDENDGKKIVDVLSKEINKLRS